MSDFILETDGRCFLCRERIRLLESHLPPTVVIKQEPESGPQEGEGALSGLSSRSRGGGLSTYVNSLRGLSRYLKLDLGKVFEKHHGNRKEEEALRIWLRSKLEVELCEGCTPLMERFSGMFRQLEKIEMEVASLVELIKGKLEGGGVEELGGGNLQRLELDVLRGKTLRNCSRKLRSAAPRIKLRPIDKRDRVQSIAKVGNQSLLEPSIDDSKVEFPEDEDGGTSGPGSGFLNMSDVDMENSELPPHSPHANDIDIDIKLEPVDYGPPTSTIPPRRKDPKTPHQLPYSILSHSGHYQCSLCPYSCPRYDSFRQHHNASHLQMRLRCVDCSKEFQHRGNYYRHRQRMHEKVKVKCDICHKSFAKGYIDDHRRETHGKVKVKVGVGVDSKKPFVQQRSCHICGNKYKHSSSLRNHLRKDH